MFASDTEAGFKVGIHPILLPSCQQVKVETDQQFRIRMHSKQHRNKILSREYTPILLPFLVEMKFEIKTGIQEQETFAGNIETSRQCVCTVHHIHIHPGRSSVQEQVYPNADGFENQVYEYRRDPVRRTTSYQDPVFTPLLPCYPVLHYFSSSS